MKDEIADRVHAEQRHQVVRVDHVPFGFGHLAVALKQPGVAEHLLRKREVEAHQEDGPVDGMEADDVLADQMEVRRPVLLIQFTVIPVHVVSEAGDIVRKGIQPDIDHVLVVEVHGDPPLEGAS